MKPIGKEKMTSKNKKISISDGKILVPNHPIIPFIQGDGIGSDIWKATKIVIDNAVNKAYGDTKKIFWKEIFAGEKGYKINNDYLSEDTLNTIKQHIVAIKGPLTTPVGKGFRSLNVTIRQKLGLYACIRPIKYIKSTPSPIKNPEKVNIVVFRENTEDVYAGIEWEAKSKQVQKVISFFKNQMNIKISGNAGIGIKLITEESSKRLIKRAISYAIEHNLASVTLMHKGNIMKYTEGAFCLWGYEVAKSAFGKQTITEADLYEKYNGIRPKGKVVIKDRIADMLFQQVLLRPDEFDVIAAPNLNGDYISDALAAQVGGLGMAPGANMSDTCAVFEATHGTAPKYANLDKVNPSSLILSGSMMLEFMKWDKASDLIQRAIEKTIQNKTVTYDLARQIKDAKEVKCSEFAQKIVENIILE